MSSALAALEIWICLGDIHVKGESAEQATKYVILSETAEHFKIMEKPYPFSKENQVIPQ